MLNFSSGFQKFRRILSNLPIPLRCVAFLLFFRVLTISLMTLAAFILLLEFEPATIAAAFKEGFLSRMGLHSSNYDGYQAGRLIGRFGLLFPIQLLGLYFLSKREGRAFRSVLLLNVLFSYVLGIFAFLVSILALAFTFLKTARQYFHTVESEPSEQATAGLFPFGQPATDGHGRFKLTTSENNYSSTDYIVDFPKMTYEVVSGDQYSESGWRYSIKLEQGSWFWIPTENQFMGEWRPLPDAYEFHRQRNNSSMFPVIEHSEDNSEIRLRTKVDKDYDPPPLAHYKNPQWAAIPQKEAEILVGGLWLSLKDAEFRLAMAENATDNTH